MKVTRRDLLKSGMAGAAVMTLPCFLATSGTLMSAATLDETPDNPFQDWFGIDEAIIAKVMAELMAGGADFADIYLQHSRSNRISLEDGLISRASTAIDQGAGLRVVMGDQVGYAFTEDLTLESMIGAAKTAAAIAKGANHALPPQHFALGKRPGYYTIELPWDQVGIAAKLPLLRRAEELTRAHDPAVKKVSVGWMDEDERVVIADSSGRVMRDRRPMSRLGISVTAEKDGKTQAHSANLAGRRDLNWYSDDKLTEVSREAVNRTMLLFDARRPPAGELPVVLAAGASGILLHEAIGHGMEADFNRKGTSIYATMLGKEVAPKFVNIIDDGTQPFERGALNVDDEGNVTERTYMVKDGVLCSYLHDRISAKHYGVQPTGSGRRESFRSTVMPRMRSTYMESGPHSRDEIVQSVKHGIIAETFTNGQVQIGAGDFTFYIKNGWLIEDGKVTAPIKDVNIIGNGPEALKNVTMVANDFKLDSGGWTCGKSGQSVPVSQGMPTVLVSKMTVGGVHG
ncbi:MAG: TldD/PmbA family protein [Planctomycetales bacterium]|nr:TldD/PmbA family protein [Planctomycetales bacterium]